MSTTCGQAMDTAELGTMGWGKSHGAAEVGCIELECKALGAVRLGCKEMGAAGLGCQGVWCRIMGAT